MGQAHGVYMYTALDHCQDAVHATVQAITCTNACTGSCISDYYSISSTTDNLHPLYWGKKDGKNGKYVIYSEEDVNCENNPRTLYPEDGMSLFECVEVKHQEQGDWHLSSLWLRDESGTIGRRTSPWAILLVASLSAALF